MKKLEDMAKDRIKISKRMKTKGYIKKRLRQNTRETWLILFKILGKTVKILGERFYESNHDRNIKMRRVRKGIFYDELEEKKDTVELILMKSVFYTRQKEQWKRKKRLSLS